MKNFKMLVAVAMLGTAAFGISSCGKYEDGPGMSLRTKKARLTGVWDTKEYVDADGTTSTDTDETTIEFTKDGNFTINSNDPDFPFALTGQWEFSDDKEQLKMTYAGDTETSTITRLTNKELWIKDADGDISKSEKK